MMISSRTYSSPGQAIGQTRSTLCICPAARRYHHPHQLEREIAPCVHRRPRPACFNLRLICQCHLAMLAGILHARPHPAQKRQYSFALAARTASILPGACARSLRCFESCPESCLAARRVLLLASPPPAEEKGVPIEQMGKG